MEVDELLADDRPVVAVARRVPLQDRDAAIITKTTLIRIQPPITTVILRSFPCLLLPSTMFSLLALIPLPVLPAPEGRIIWARNMTTRVFSTLVGPSTLGREEERGINGP